MLKQVFVIISVLGFFACQPSPKAQTNKLEEKTQEESTTGSASDNNKTATKKIVFFGDSLTAAYGLSEEEGFPSLIQEKLKSEGYEHYEVISAGVSGETTSDGNNRISWTLKQPIDIFILELGANDAFRGTDPNITEKNLQAIIDKVKTKYPACKIILAGMLAPPNLGSAYTSKFKRIYPQLAKKNNLALIPFILDGVAGDKSLNLPDGIHPTAEGYKIVAENVWKVLREVL